MRTSITLSILALPFLLQAQTLFMEDFESAPAFAINTTDVGSIAGISNTWLINSVYTGGPVSTDCLGVPVDFTVGNSVGQPIGITCANGNYLHIASLIAVANGVQCGSFGAADGYCTNADDNFARMTTDVNTSTY